MHSRDEKLANSIHDNLLNYVGTATDTNTKKENNVIVFWNKWFKERQYFKDNPEYWGFHSILKDPLNRSVPWGLVKGKGDKTIVLIHHSDTVDTLDYGRLKKIAYHPEELMEALLKDELDLNIETKEDLESGDWIFGRGVADMKGGGSIQLALVDKYSKKSDFEGNLLILALPDEENLSAGMRGAINLLKNLKNKFSLDYVLMIDSEPHEREDKDCGVLYDGSIGKVMPIIYVRGKLAHVGQIYNGFNPILLMSEIVKRTELNTCLMDTIEGEAAPPPTWLYLKDRKAVYDVSLPISVGGYMSILTLNSSPKDIFNLLENICKDAFTEVINHMNNTYKEYARSINKEYKKLPWEVNVKSFSNVFQEAMADFGDEFISEYNSTLKQLKKEIEENSITIPEACFTLIEKTLEFRKDLSPIVVIGMSPPYYPHVSNDMINDLPQSIEELIDHIMDFAKDKFGQEYRLQKFYTGISDLSYGMFTEDESIIKYIENNMLMWGNVYDIPLEIIKELSMPVINIGPWGKDFHKNSERVYKEDLYYRTPMLIEEAINNILG